MLFMKSRNSTQRRRFECVAMIFPVATSSAANNVNDIGGFGRKVRVGALAPGLASREVNLVVAQEPPDILDVNIAQRSASRGPVQRANPCGGGLSSSFRIRWSVVFV